jgi:hypothetical protein
MQADLFDVNNQGTPANPAAPAGFAEFLNP